MYTYSNGTWGDDDSLTNKIDLAFYGFNTSTELTSRLGPVYYYSRTDSGKPLPKFQYVFLVKMYMGSLSKGCYWVWVASLPSLIQLFNEIDAHPLEDVSDNATAYDFINYLRDETHFAEAMQMLYESLKLEMKNRQVK